MVVTLVKPIITEHDTEWHWWAFSDFCKLKREVSEPSPHMQMIGSLTASKNPVEKVWFSCLYTAFYNIPSALVMWQDWPWDNAYDVPNQMENWLTEHWQGITTRIERRAVRTVPNMSECLRSCVEWTYYFVPQYLNLEDTPENYDRIWQETEQQLRFMGRYIIIRLLECLHRFVGLKPKLYDIRSIGGWSPKRALGLLFPEQLDLLLSSDTKENVAKVDALAFQTIDKLANEYNIKMSPYVFAAMLCEYRVAYENRKQYPGWTIDQEPAHWYKIKDYWKNTRGEKFTENVEKQFFDARKKLFPIENLGEINGWKDTRVPPRMVLRDYSYNWCDKLYDYNATTDFGNPVKR